VNRSATVLRLAGPTSDAKCPWIGAAIGANPAAESAVARETLNMRGSAPAGLRTFA
jgi:hypothetical protein